MRGSSNRRNFLKAIGAGAGWLASGGLAAHGGTRRTAPHVIVVLADDLGYGDVGCYGHPFAKTPHIDSLARDGMKLTACYSAGVNCSPSRAGLLTGRHPYRAGIYDWIPVGSDIYLPSSELSLPRWLKQHGYATCFVGKWHLAGRIQSKNQSDPGDHGFDHWFATAGGPSPAISPNNFARNGKRTSAPGLAAHAVVGEAIDWLESRGPADTQDEPICLFVWFHEPHAPVVTTEFYRALYSGQRPEDANYYGGVSHMDDAFGKLLAALERLGYAQDSFLMFTSDNGPSDIAMSDGSPGRWRGKKARTYEGGIRIPGLIRWPGTVTPGSTSDVQVIGTDLFPTCCEIAHVPLPPDRVLDGRSFLPLLTGEGQLAERPYFWHHPRHMYAIRDGRWKLMVGFAPLRFELYDLEVDPGERNDVVAEHPERLQHMLTRLNALITEVNEGAPVWPNWPTRGPYQPGLHNPRGSKPAPS